MSLKNILLKKMSKLYLNEKVLLLSRNENIVLNGESAQFDQFLLSLHYFQKSSCTVALGSVFMWERVPHRDASVLYVVENIVTTFVTNDLNFVHLLYFHLKSLPAILLRYI